MLGVSFRAAESDERLVLLKLAHANTALLLLFEFQLFDLLCRFRANARAEGKLGSELGMLQNIRSGRLDIINVSGLDGDLSSLKCTLPPAAAVNNRLSLAIVEVSTLLFSVRVLAAIGADNSTDLSHDHTAEK